MNVITITFKNIVLLQANFNVKIPRRPAIGAWLAVAGASNTHAAVNTCRNFDFQCFLSFDLALALARVARLGNDLAVATTSRAGLLHTEKSLTHLHRAGAAAGATGFGLGTWFGTVAVAYVA